MRALISVEDTKDHETWFRSHIILLLVLSHVRLSVTPWTVAHQTLLTMGFLQASILDWVAMPSSRGSSQPRDQTQISHNAGSFVTT